MKKKKKKKEYNRPVYCCCRAIFHQISLNKNVISCDSDMRKDINLVAFKILFIGLQIHPS